MTLNFKKYTLDFIVVFLGISVSFGLNNLNEKRKDRVLENNYYENLKYSIWGPLEDYSLNEFERKAYYII